MVFGPFVGERLAAFAPQIALLRGMTVSSVAHVPATTHALTGKDPAGELPRGSSIASILAGALGADDLIPNLASGVESWNLGGPDYASALAAANGSDLRKLLQPGFVALEPAERSALDDFFAAEAERVANPRLRSILGRRESSRMLIEREVAGLFDETNPDLADIVAHFDGQPRAFLAYQALTSGTSRCVSYEAHRFNDTHSGPDWRANHGYRLLSGFQSVAMLAEMLQATPHPAGGSWLDHTTIVCASEFNRSPALNATGGRDHATTNSMLLLGGGIARRDPHRRDPPDPHGRPGRGSGNRRRPTSQGRRSSTAMSPARCFTPSASPKTSRTSGSPTSPRCCHEHDAEPPEHASFLPARAGVCRGSDSPWCPGTGTDRAGGTLRTPRPGSETTTGTGFGDPFEAVEGCPAPTGYVADDTDCDDTDPEALPGRTWYPDIDGDGFGDPSTSIESCARPEGHISRADDCDDMDSTRHPDADWNTDADADGYGDPASPVPSCVATAEDVADDSDCDDADPDVHPLAVEVCDYIDKRLRRIDGR